jgi:thioester reductase-like protein
MDTMGDNAWSGHHPKEPLAIIGMACRFPGAVADVESFWRLLASCQSGIVEIPPDRWNRNRYYHPQSAIPNRMHSKWGGFVDQLHGFDARFWGISPREAARMDPQQRWLLEVAWEAIEDAGVPPRKLSGTNTGVFVGISSSDYAQIQMTNHAGLDVHSNSGNTLSIASNRISYALDLKGPSVSVDTACSSSLVAVSLACRSIWDGTCDAALVGGVNAVIVPSTTMAFSKASMLSPDGQCFAFDARANGYVRGDGAGVVYIKPLVHALQDRDPVYAVIRAAVANQDGKTSSMMVPSEKGQTEMLEQAYREAGIPPSHVLYVEAHGTGTPLGDPIEAAALGKVLSRGRADGERCLVGSVKTNIGHLEAGSGIAGLIKAALILHKRAVPPNLNFATANPQIPLERLKLEVPTQLRPLPRQEGIPSVTAVNSFGFGGTNAHVVLEEAVRSDGRVDPPGGACRADRPCLLPISARDDNALQNYVKAYRRLLRDESLPLSDVCSSAGARKEHHPQRLAVIGRSHEEMRERLSVWLANPEEAGGVVGGAAAREAGPITFVFTGQGPQWWAMGQQLLEREPLFRRAIEEVDRVLASLADWSLLDEMTRPEATSRIDQTHIAQPAIFALQIALTELWKSWGIAPGRVIGHSVGEVAAAYCAGIYSLEDAAHVVFHRSRLQHATRGRGRMLAAGISAAEARQLIGTNAARVYLSAINSPHLVTLSGDAEPLESIAAKLREGGKFFRWLGIDYAFHTHQMDPIREELQAALADIQPRPGHIPFISTVTGGLLLGENLDASYWWKNVRLPVLFAPVISNLIASGVHLFLEVGPHPSLRSSIEDCLAERGQRAAVFHSLRRSADESEEMLANLAGLHARGVPVDWTAVNQSSGEFVRLPHYPWTHEPFWLESAESVRNRLAEQTHPLLGLRIEAVQPTWEFVLDARLFPYINDHQLWGRVVFPAAGYAEIGLALARECYADQPHVVEHIEIRKALFALEDKITTVRIVLDEREKTFFVHSATGNHQDWELHAQGQLTPLVSEPPEPIDLKHVRQALAEYVDHEQYYVELAAAGYGFGPSFRHVQNVWRTRGEALAEINVPEDLAATIDDYHFHPAVLDACFQVFRAAQNASPAATSQYLFLPSHIGRIRLYRHRPPTHLWAHARQTLDDGKSLVCDVYVYDHDGRRVADILGFRVDPVERKSAGDDVENCLYRFQWQLCRLRGTGAEGPCHFATTEEIASAAEQRVPQFYEQYGLNHYARDFLPRSERIICQYIQNAFLKLGWTAAVGDVFHFADFVRQLGIVRQHQRVARIQLAALVKAGLLRSLGQDSWEVVQPPRTRATDADVAALEGDYPRLAPTEIALSKLNGEAAAELLTGELNATELLFPGGSARLVGQFYCDGLDFPVHNRLIPIAVAKAIENLPSQRALRVLEIGAGTGSLTRELLPVLPSDRTEYLFTDIGPAFLTAAKGQFGDYPFVDYKVFDLEKPAAEQGLVTHGYDLVLASAVLHATEDLRRTLGNIQTCLATDGLLIFLEPIHRRSGTDIIFGGLPGWWKFTDTDLRPDHALMGRERWKRLLAECGYRDVRSVLSAPSEEEAEQAILIAIAPESRDTIKTSPRAANHEEQSTGCFTKPASSMQHPASSNGHSATTHIFFADEHGLADAVIAMIRARGDRAVRIALGAEFHREGADDFTVAAECEEDLRRVILGVGPSATITHCLSLDHLDGHQLSLEGLRSAQHTGVLHALRLAHVLVELEPDPPPRVYFVTRDVQKVVERDSSRRLASAPLVGFARVANAEHAPFRFTAIDLAAELSPDEGEQLFNELVFGDRELEVAYRGGRRYANRLHRVRTSELPRRTRPAVDQQGRLAPYRLQIDKPGMLGNLSLNETRRIDPGPDEIEVRVHAGGINFRDVMKALGMYPGNPVDLKWFGDDFAGTVERVGDNVTQFTPGDRVAGIAPYCFRAYAIANWRMAFGLPEHMSFEGAATLPTVFLTAHYAINTLARMQPGERILIHAGTGGVGQAAIQISQRLGLEIFATAGTPEKRRLLAEWGVPHVMDSRTLDFADKVLDITHGRGVDAVLNSLAGPFVHKSMSVLAPFGRFLEIGKVDVYGNTKIGLESFKHNISYFVIDLAQCLEHKPHLVASMFAELACGFASGAYRPLSHQVFPITDVVEAFRYMAQGKHTGKNVLVFDHHPIPIGRCTEDGCIFRPDASYLITGGAGGFGWEVAKWMAEQGARYLVLMSRSGPRDNDSQADITRLRACGVTVVDARGDVTNPVDVRRVVQDIRTWHPPLRGVIHGAMVLDDGFIADLDEEQFNRAMHPKMLGAWNLHTETLDEPLDHFICFSSFSDVAGGAKQANYNAGNFFLDCLAFYRQSLNLPGLTCSWGGISGAGFVHRNEKIAQYFEKIGFQSFSVDEALRILRLLLQYNPGQIAVARLNWQNMERFSPFVASSNMYAALTREKGKEGSGAAALPQILAATPDERLALVKSLLAQQLAAVCNIDVSKVDYDTSIIKLGLDSLMAIELINRVENELGLVIPMGKVLGGPTLGELSETVVQLLAYAADEVPGTDGSAGTGTRSLVLLEGANEPETRSALSEGQQAIWFLQRLAPPGLSHNTALAAKLTPAPDVEMFSKAFQLLLARHPMLSVTFSDENGEPAQHACTANPAHCNVHDWSRLPANEVNAILTERANAPFDLERGPVVRIDLYRINDDSSVMLLCAHRLVADAWSMTVMLDDLTRSYSLLQAGAQPDPAPPEFSYHGFVAWERRFLASDAAERGLAFWKEQLAGAPALLDLPVDRPRPTQLTFRGESQAFRLEDELAHRLVVLSAEQDVTLFATLLSAFKLLLHRLCRQNDLLVGCPLAGRDHVELADVVGCLSNPVALRSKMDGDPTFRDLLHSTSQQMADAGQHQRYPLARLMARLRAPRHPARWPLCQAAFAMERVPGLDQRGIAPFLIGQGGHRIRIEPLTLESLELEHHLVPAEIMLRIEEAGGKIVGCWQYSRDLFAPATISGIAQMYCELLWQIVQHPAAPVSTFRPTQLARASLGDIGESAGAPSLPARDTIIVPHATSEVDERRGTAPFVAPRSETEHRVARVWEELLGVRPVGMRDDFFALGGHSLNVTALCARLHHMFSVDLPLSTLFTSPTVEGVAAYIDSRRDWDAPPVIDPIEVEFEEDAELDPDITAPEDVSCNVDNMERVLLTGATGFLGAFLLDELIRQTGADVYCLVRASSPRHGLQRLRQNLEKYGLSWSESAERVIPVVGDLAQPRLGLADAQFDQLARDIDVIYHNGAVLNFAYTYKVLRDSNVLGTHEILRLAFQNRLKPTHYVSTVAVLASSDRQAFDVVNEDDPMPPFTSLRDAYSQTKWVSEKLIAEARSRGLPVSVYRPAGITGHSETGNSNTGDLIHVMALGCYHLGTIPQLDVEFNLAPVDFVAGALVELSRQRGCLGGTYHLVNPKPLRLDTLVNWVLQSQLPLERMPYEDWRSRVSAHVEALPSDIFGLLTKFFMPGVISGDMKEAIPPVLQLRYDCRHTLAALAGSGLTCPQVNEELLTLYLSHLRRFGLVLSTGDTA